MRFLPRLTIIVILCLMTIALLPLPAAAVCRFPEISLSATKGIPGDSVTVSGSDFDPDGYVDIYYYLDSTTRISLKEDVIPNFSRRFSVTITIPPSSTGDHKVRAVGMVDGEIVERDAVFRVQPGLTVSPTQGAAGTNVTVQGLGFGENETGIEVRYYFNGSYQTVAENIPADGRGSWQATFAVPSSTNGEYRILARGDKTLLIAAVRPATFTVKPGIRIDEPSGGVGQAIPVSGSGFAANERGIRILLDGEVVATDIRADDTGYWEASFEVPEMPAGEYSVTAEGEQTRQTEVGDVSFEIRPLLVLSPDEGHVGMNVTVAGQGFPPGKNVVILYDGSQVATTTTDAEGSFDVSFNVPESRHGGRQVTAAVIEGINSTANLGANATAIFFVESNHPQIPELISPTDGRRVGRIFKVRPTFEWAEVYDDSGVCYNLQVATSGDFTPDSVLASVTGLTGTSYTLPQAEALPNGTYYWRVQAVDRAENESGWAEAESFRAGRLPLWAFIVIIVFLALLLGLRAYFILVKPRFYD